MFKNRAPKWDFSRHGDRTPSLTERNQEAITNQMTFLEFLALLAQDEILVREQRSYEKRLKKSDFKGHKTLENFDFDLKLYTG